MQRFIFTYEAQPIFESLLRQFHEEHVEGLQIAGVGANDSKLEEVSVTKMLNPLSLCRKIVGGLCKIDPVFHVLCEDREGNKHAELVITYLHNKNDTPPYVEDWYMMQNVYDCPEPGKCLFQVWKLRLCLPSTINNFWRA